MFSVVGGIPQVYLTLDAYGDHSVDGFEDGFPQLTCPLVDPYPKPRPTSKLGPPNYPYPLLPLTCMVEISTLMLTFNPLIHHVYPLLLAPLLQALFPR